ncbi:MAG: hypothetical protein HY706_14790 [Candidatus Hydrogenedentes bacterium]|nr:hypothetical protein [Candidatus Hydrogenedentota bacterium]
METGRQSEDTLGRFLNERTVTANNALVTKSALYAAYRAWCKSNAERPVSQRAFSQSMSEHGFDSYPMATRENPIAEAPTRTAAAWTRVRS